MKVKNIEMENLFGKINKENVLIGNIIKCTEYDVSNYMINEDIALITSFGSLNVVNKPYKENQILIRICDNPEVYVELKKLKTFLTYISIYSKVDKNGIILVKIILSTSASYIGDIYVDRKSLKPYYNENGKVKVKKIKRDVLLDSRIKGGIEH